MCVAMYVRSPRKLVAIFPYISQCILRWWHSLFDTIFPSFSAIRHNYSTCLKSALSLSPFCHLLRRNSRFAGLFHVLLADIRVSKSCLNPLLFVWQHHCALAETTNWNWNVKVVHAGSYSVPNGSQARLASANKIGQRWIGNVKKDAIMAVCFSLKRLVLPEESGFCFALNVYFFLSRNASLHSM